MSDDWCVAVFKCKKENVGSILVDFYSFVKNVEDVKNQHFLIRDRVLDEVVFSYRVLVEPKAKEVIRSKLAYKLGTLLSKDDFAVDPDPDHPFRKYVAWSSEGRLAEYGPKKFAQFCCFLGEMSRLVIQMMKKGYFSSAERVEMAHVMSWMLGCTEYGLLSTQHWEIGYYDRIENKNYQYLKQNFPKP